MIQITKDEATFLRENKINLYKTCQLKRDGRKRGKYFVAETKEVSTLLKKYRKSEPVTYAYP